ncbi:transglutaminase N-terminal domain-containing protein, partial [Leptospira sp. SA-E8]|uniref:transglutaminase N-terminal domain-containing protein n=1 Tax=Leptospira sp. SA-E8 TaxID=3422259 RepID=UPI003EB8AF89
MDLHITHETRYDYASAVEMAQHIAYLRPLDTPWQTVRAHRLDIETASGTAGATSGDDTPGHAGSTGNASLQSLDATSPDVYGNHRSFFALHTPHTRLRVTAQSRLSTQAPLAAEQVLSEITWEALRESDRYQAHAAWN